MKKKLALLAFALSAVSATMALAPAPAEAVRCWTTCCSSGRCYTCCIGQACPDVICP